MQKMVKMWAVIALVLGVGHTMWGWWGVTSLVALGVVTYIGYEFYQYIMYDAPRVRDGSHTALQKSYSYDLETTLARIRKNSEESSRRHDRWAQLENLETDLEHGKKLMKLEEKAHKLRIKYAQRNTHYSQDVEDTLRDLFEDIERMKRGEVA